MSHRVERITVVLVALLTASAIATGGALGVGAAPGYEQTATVQADADDEPHFEVADVETNAPINAGEELTTTITVENTGGADGETDVSFSLDEYQKDSTSVSVEAGATETVELSYVTQYDDDGEWTLTVETDDDSSSQSITIEEAGSDDEESSDDSDDSGSSGGTGGSGSTGGSGTTGGTTGSGGTGGTAPAADFQITDVETNSPIEAGEQLNVTVDVENVGDAEEEKRVWVEFENETLVQDRFTLEAGAEATMNGTYQTEYDHHDVSNITIGTPDHTLEESIEIEEIAAANISEFEAPDEVEAGETVDVTANVTNVGELAINDTASLIVENTTVDEQPLELDVNESTTVELSYTSSSSAAGEWNVTLSTGTDEVQTTMTIAESADDDATTGAAAANETDADDADDATDAVGSGFGAGVALAALLSTALLARARIAE